MYNYIKSVKLCDLPLCLSLIGLWFAPILVYLVHLMALRFGVSGDLVVAGYVIVVDLNSVRPDSSVVRASGILYIQKVLGSSPCLVTFICLTKSNFKPFILGQKVWLEAHNLKTLYNKKIKPKQEGPFPITEVLNLITYYLALPLT